VGLKVNEEKKKFMQETKRPITSEIGSYDFEIVQEFKYLGTIVTNDNNMDKELRNRIILANKCYHGLKGKFKSHFLTLHTKLRLYKTLLRPVLMYGSESWMLTRNNEQSLRIVERKVLRRIFGRVFKNGFWRLRYNNELYELFSEPDVVKTIKI
jgi:hypothetical protein